VLQQETSVSEDHVASIFRMKMDAEDIELHLLSRENLKSRMMKFYVCKYYFRWVSLVL